MQASESDKKLYLLRQEDITLLIKADTAFMATCYANVYLEANDLIHNKESSVKPFETHEAFEFDINKLSFGVALVSDKAKTVTFSNEEPFYKPKFRTFGKPLPFPLDVDADWVRIHCGVDGNPNYIFGEEGLIEFLKAGAGIYHRKDGKPTQSIEELRNWYNKEKAERIGVTQKINQIKNIIKNSRIKL